MDVIVLAVAFLQLGAEVVADLGENRREVLDRQSRKDLTPVFCDKDQMDVKAVNDVPSGADILHIAIRPITCLGMILTYRYRVKDKTSAKHLRRMSRAANFGWEYSGGPPRGGEGGHTSRAR